MHDHIMYVIKGIIPYQIELPIIISLFDIFDGRKKHNLIRSKFSKGHDFIAS